MPIQRRHPGLFITLEGVEGSGKTTQIERLARKLRAAGRRVITTREPGGTVLGEHLRKLILDPPTGADPAHRLDPWAGLLLYLAARAQHVTEVIRPALEAGEIVLCDRFTDATIAYQGYGQGLPVTRLKPLIEKAAGGLTPDLTILLDLSAKKGLERVARRTSLGGESNRFDRERLRFHERVRAGYLRIARRAASRVQKIRADRKPDAVARDIEARVARLLSRKGPS
jgi:dTMP kinase